MIHAELGASGSDRWMNCPGSIRLERPFPNVSTEYTREGTCAHEVAERCLKDGLDPAVFLGVSFEGVEVTEEMIEAVQVYLNHCRPLMHDSGAVYIERQFDLSALNPPAPMFGTSDFSCVIGDTLYVVDYKHGKGYAVPARGNPQLRYYALGALLALDKELAEKVRHVVVTIVQPRASHPDGIIRSDELDVGELLTFSEDLMTKAEATLHEDSPMVPGGWCRFCRAQAVCPAQKAQAVAIAQMEFAEITEEDRPPAPETLPDDVLVDILEKLPILESWMKSIREHVHTRLMEGKPFPGYKLVEKRATRKWFSESQVEEWGRAQMGLTDEELFEKKLKSPAQLEKVLGKGSLPEELVSKVSSGYNLAPDYDSRPAINIERGEEFAALPPGEPVPEKAATKTRRKK